MESMGDMLSVIDSPPISSDSTPVGSADSTGGVSDAFRLAEVKAWLASQFEAADGEVPEFEYTQRSVAHLHSLASLSQARTRAATIVASDLRLKASEYWSQAVRIREILECVGLAPERFSSSAIGSAQVIASVENLLNIRDTEMSSFVVAMGDLMLRKEDVQEKRTKLQKESKTLLEYTRKAIAKLNDLKKTLVKFENEVPIHEAQMHQWQTNLAIMDSKEGKINHGVLMEMAEHRKDLEKKTKPISDTLRSYKDLPPDKTLAALAIEDKKRQYAAAEK